MGNDKFEIDNAPKEKKKKYCGTLY